MESREKLLERLDVAQKASLDKLDTRLGVDPSAIMLQQGANAPIVATAVTVIAEVLVDIRDELVSMNEGLTALPVGQGESLVLLTEKQKAQVRAKLSSRDCPECGAKGGMKYMLDRGYWVCFSCSYRLNEDLTGEQAERKVGEALEEQVEQEIDRALEKEGAPQCPECKGLRVAIDTLPDKKDDKTLDYKFKYVCENCGHEWSA